MPPTPKSWNNFPSTSTQIDATSLTGLEYRASNYVGAQEIGTGVGGMLDFQVTQSAGGLVVNVGPATGVIQRCFLPGDGNGGTQRYDYGGAQLTATAPAADPTNPRVDLVTIAPPANVDAATPQVILVQGTPTVGATLANRNGAPVVPPGRIAVAYLLIPANATSILTIQIRDARGFPIQGVSSALFSAVDQVIPVPADGIQDGVYTATAGTNDNRTGMMLVWVPRRILAARIRWKYRNGATPATSTYRWGLASASGRVIALTASIALGGSASAGRAQSDPFATPVQIEAGAYWLAFQLDTMTASSSFTFYGYNGQQTSATPGVPGPNLYGFSNTVSFLGSNPELNPATDSFGSTADTVTIAVPSAVIGA